MARLPTVINIGITLGPCPRASCLPRAPRSPRCWPPTGQLPRRRGARRHAPAPQRPPRRAQRPRPPPVRRDHRADRRRRPDVDVECRPQRRAAAVDPPGHARLRRPRRRSSTPPTRPRRAAADASEPARPTYLAAAQAQRPPACCWRPAAASPCRPSTARRGHRSCSPRRPHPDRRRAAEGLGDVADHLQPRPARARRGVLLHLRPRPMAARSSARCSSPRSCSRSAAPAGCCSARSSSPAPPRHRRSHERPRAAGSRAQATARSLLAGAEVDDRLDQVGASGATNTSSLPASVLSAQGVEVFSQPADERRRPGARRRRPVALAGDVDVVAPWRGR